ncbi:metal dependent phosphohydrolase [Thauera linaloolentis 47Lol = DSM 12138]|uniref:Metal dependent phosphohydrolase n=2 Tax=Thauera linaloolentis TaxID=76112 RepID=N6Z7J3_THAL4|nr:metal dependent phosphohydrolase [Thauera linaloolentis 47Lol = DSM 12138]
MMQGFLVTTSEEIAALQHYCRHVVIDRTRSVGEHHSSRIIEGDEPRRVAGVRTDMPDQEAECRDEASRFLEVARSFKGRIHTQRQPNVPRVRPVDGRSRLESELLYSAPIVDDVYRALRETQVAIDAGDGIDASRLEGLVGEMAQGVERNPDALMWLTRLKRTDRYTYDHAVNVSVHAMVFARFVGLDIRSMRQLGLAGLLQDIGKVKVDHDILAKAGPLDERELEHVRAHVSHTLALLEADEGFDPEVLGIVAAHHERFDGTGYPHGLSGMRIPLPAEMAGLIDTYCAMTRDRVYSPAVSSQRAMEEINRLRNILFRDTLVDQFLQCIGLYPIGTLVELSSGEVAVVIQQNQVRRLQPRVMVILGQDKAMERYPRTLDLLMQPDTAAGEPYRIVRALPPNAYGIDPNDFYLA